MQCPEAMHRGSAGLALFMAIACAVPTAMEETDPAGASAGYLVHHDGWVDPFCHAVLVGPTLVLTPTHCARRDAPSWLSFAVALAPDAFVGVDGEVGSALDDGPLTLLRLEAAPALGGSAAVGARPSLGDRVSATSFAATIRGDGLPPASGWTAEVIEVGDDAFVAELVEGRPGCHGERGVAAWVDDRLVGVLVGTAAGGPEHPASPVCVTRYRFAVPDPGAWAAGGR